MNGRNELLSVLHRTRQLLAQPNNDFAWSHWNGTEEALREFDLLVERIEGGDKSRKRELKLLFAPSGSIQEVSMSGGWADEFLALAEKFDSVIKSF